MKPSVVLFYFIMLCLVGGGKGLWAQTLEKDKIDAQLAKATQESQKSYLLNDLANFYLGFAPDSAFKLAKQAQKIAQKYHQSDALATSYFISGRVLYEQGAFNLALENYFNALQLYKIQKDLKGQAVTYQHLGLAYQYAKKLPVALDHYKKALDLFGQLDDKAGIAGTLSHIGHLFEKQQYYNQAIDYQQKALGIYEQIQDKTGLAKVLDNMGSIYEDLKDYPKAYEYFSQALAYNRQANNQVNAVVDLNNLGDILQKQGKYNDALPFFFEGLALARKLHQRYQLRSVYRDISQTYFLLDNPSKAYTYLDSAYEMYGEVYNLETARQTAEMQVIYQTQEKDKEITLLERDKKISTLWWYILGVGGSLLFLLAVVIVNRQRLLLNKNRKILEQNELLFEAERALQRTALENANLNEAQLKIQLENKQLKAQTLQNELDTRNRELTGRTLTIVQKNEILTDIITQIQLALRKPAAEKDELLQQLSGMIDKNIQLNKDWNEFQLAFEQIHSDFFTRLQQEYPELTAGDLRLCSLIRLNMDSKDMANTLGISQDSLRVNRHRLRKKLRLQQKDSLTNFMMTF